MEEANCATLATLRAGLDSFQARRPYGITSLRHDQACWAVKMFLNEWQEMAAELGWTADDIFQLDGLAYWLGTELVTALGPGHAVTEDGRVYDRMTRATWINPYSNDTLQ